MLNLEHDRYKLAMELAEKTNKHVFLTGKAGTGKTTFLHLLRGRTFKRHIVVAPTGVAAINAHGVTIHSFFQLPLRPILPDELNNEAIRRKELFRFSAEKQKIIRTLDLLIIDEISMVRADILDAVDYVLRMIRHNDRPFGNVQLLMIGDLYQLAPVVKTDEWQLLSSYYNSPFFFESQALKRTEYVTIELDKIFRQQDEDFVRILNKVREGILDEDVFQTLNGRYVSHFDEKKYENYILLTTHNAKASQINQSKLDELQGKQKIYHATVKGIFPPEIYPTEASLALKVGAQVMFLRNDVSDQKLYYNGKIGKVIELHDNHIKVKTADDDAVVSVEPEVWENIQYSLDPETKTIKEEIIGTFTQFPLKLAWSITIHKSQGLTFDRVAIDAQHAFAHGQVYVALSRCRSIEGLVLLSKIGLSSVRVNSYLKEYCGSHSIPTPSEVVQAQKDFLFQLVEDLFSFTEIETTWKSILFVLQNYGNNSDYSPFSLIQQISEDFKNRVNAVAARFLDEVRSYYLQTQEPQLPDSLQDRIRKAVAYFNEQLTLIIEPLMLADIELFDAEADQKFRRIHTQLLNSLARKKFCLLAVKEGFFMEKYLQAKAEADLKSSRQILSVLHNQNVKVPHTGAVQHNELLSRLKQWRKTKAKEVQWAEDNIISNLMLVKLSIKKPTTDKELAQILKFPDEYATRWNSEILQIVKEYGREIKKSPDPDE